MRDSDFDGSVLNPYDYEENINHIEIPHERTRHRNGALAKEEKAIARSELWKLMLIARIARHGAIYDDSAAAQTFPEGNITAENEESEDISKIEEDLMK